MFNDVANQIFEEIQKANHILLHCHVGADGDSYGSSLAFHHYLVSIGKKITHIIDPGESAQNFSILPGFEKIKETAFDELDKSDIDLFIILDSPNKIMISRKGVTFPKTLRTIKIDHHNEAPELLTNLKLVDTEKIATSEIIFDLFQLWNVKITKDMASNLLIGIYTDSLFKYKKTTSHTFLVASKLAELSPNFPDLIFEIENQLPENKLSFMGLCLNNIHKYFSGNLVCAEINNALIVKNKLSVKDTQKSLVTNWMRSVVGWNITARITEFEPNKVNISFRTRDANRWNVAEIAKTLNPNGGGHAAAASTDLEMSFNEAKEKLLDVVAKLHPEFGNP